jgi:hypothetical protein
MSLNGPFKKKTHFVGLYWLKKWAFVLPPGLVICIGSARYFYVSIDLWMKCTSLGAFLEYKSLTKSMYLFITNIFYVHSFSIKLIKSFKIYMCKKLTYLKGLWHKIF